MSGLFFLFILNLIPSIICHITNFLVSSFHQLTDILFAELPRVRLDRVRRPAKSIFDTHSTLREVPEESDNQGDNYADIQHNIDLNTTLGSALGEWITFDIKQKKNCFSFAEKKFLFQIV